MTYVRSIAALFVLVGVGALYDVSSGAPLDSAEGVSPQHVGAITFSEPVVTITTSVETSSPEEPQELPSVEEESVQEESVQEEQESDKSARVPFYSQFADISAVEWRKIGCGVASLAMIIDYYKPAVSVDTLLTQGIAANAYISSAGWTYKGLIGVGQTYGLEGSSHDLASLSSRAAFEEFNEYLKEGPVIASVHYEFDPASTIPHLVVINEIVGDTLYYNDPAASTGGREISTADFLKAWKKRFIVIRPA